MINKKYNNDNNNDDHNLLKPHELSGGTNRLAPSNQSTRNYFFQNIIPSRLLPPLVWATRHCCTPSFHEIDRLHVLFNDVQSLKIYLASSWWTIMILS